MQRQICRSIFDRGSYVHQTWTDFLENLFLAPIFSVILFCSLFDYFIRFIKSLLFNPSFYSILIENQFFISSSVTSIYEVKTIRYSYSTIYTHSFKLMPDLLSRSGLMRTLADTLFIGEYRFAYISTALPRCSCDIEKQFTKAGRYIAKKTVLSSLQSDK